MAVTGRVVGSPTWHPYRPQHGELLNISFEYSEVIWPWSGYLAIFIEVKDNDLKFERRQSSMTCLVGLVICCASFVLR